MPHPEATSLLDRATAQLRRSSATEVLPMIQRAVELDPQNARGQRLLGTALAQSGKAREGVRALQRSVELNPADPVAWYNLSLAQVHAEDREEAKLSLQKALELNPKYPEAMALAADTKAGRYDPGEVHTVPWIADAGEAWTKLGWALVLFALLVAVGRWIHPPAAISAVENARSGFEGVTLNRDPVSIVLVFLSFVSGVASFMWVLADMVDRKTRTVWIVPMLVFTFCGCLIALPQALYIAIGRK